MMDNFYKTLIKERIEQYGIDSLMDEETLSLLTGIPLVTLKKSLEVYNLPELIKYVNTMNLSQIQKRKLELLYDFSKRLNLSSYKEKTQISSSNKAGEYFLKKLSFMKNEVFAIAFLNSQNRLIKTEIVSHGTINEAPVYPREIIKLVLDNNANSVILAHNHPGGSQEPSKCDLDITRKIKHALETISVNVIDHIIVANDAFTSFAEKGLLHN